MNPKELAAAARSAPPKVRLEEYRDAVEELREKGYSWREVADFLNERGVPTDHTRVYRLFGEPAKKPPKEARPVEVTSLNFVGERPTKRGSSWSVVEVELPSKLGAPIAVLGYVWGTDDFAVGRKENDPVAFRSATLITKSGRKGFPMAYLRAELQSVDTRWKSYDIYVVPKWGALL